MEIAIRLYTINDKQACLIAFESNVPKYFTLKEIGQFEQWLDYLGEQVIKEIPERDSFYYVVTAGDRIIGCGGFGYDQTTNEATLAWGLVDQAWHKRSIGKQLLEYRLQQVKTLFPGAAILLDTTQYAYPFFEKYGFVIVRFTKDFYAPGMHRYDMKLA